MKPTHRTRSLGSLAAAVALAAVLARTAAADAPYLQVFPFSGVSLAPDGNSAVYIQPDPGTSAPELFRWTRQGGSVPLAPAGGLTSIQGQSADGSVVYANGSNGDLYRWTQTTGLTDLSNLRQVGFHIGTITTTTGVSRDGTQLIGTITAASGPQAAVWSASTNQITNLGVLSGDSQSQPTGISADGSTIIGASYTSGINGGRGFRWTRTGGIAAVGGFAATSVSADGSVVAGVAGTGLQLPVFRWTAQAGTQLIDGLVAFGGLPRVTRDGSAIFGATPAGFLPVPGGAPIADPARWTPAQGLVNLAPATPHTALDGTQFISVDGSVAAGTATFSGGGLPFSDTWVWDQQHGTQGLVERLAQGGVDGGFVIETLQGMSEDGHTFIGGVINPTSYTWIAHLPDLGTATPDISVPEPAGLLYALTLVGVLHRRRRPMVRRCTSCIGDVPTVHGSWRRVGTAMKCLIVCSFLGGSIKLASEARAADAPYYQVLTNAFINNISLAPDGNSVAYTQTDPATSLPELFRWTPAGGSVALGDLTGSTGGGALGMSADGSIIYAAGSDNHTYRWTQSTGLVDLSVLRQAGFQVSTAGAQTGVSHDGSQLIGTIPTAAGKDPAVWSAATNKITDLGLLPGGAQGVPTGISTDGSTVIGASISPKGQTAFRWTRAGGLVDLGRFSNSTTYTQYAPLSLSGDGSVIVGRSGSSSPFDGPVFRWTQNGGMQPISGLESEDFPKITRDGRAVFGGTGSGVAFNGTPSVDPARWTEQQGVSDLAAGVQTFRALGAVSSGVSADGSVAFGGYAGVPWVWTSRDGLKSLTYRLARGGLTPLLSPTPPTDLIGGMSEDGRTFIGGTGSGGSYGVVYTWIAHLPDLGPLPGDANGDGVVNFNDLLILAQSYGKTATATTVDGDFNSDGSVGFDDLLILAQNYGRGAAMAAAPVPEPSALVPAAAVGVALLGRRSRRASVR